MDNMQDNMYRDVVYVLEDGEREVFRLPGCGGAEAGSVNLAKGTHERGACDLASPPFLPSLARVAPVLFRDKSSGPIISFSACMHA